MDGETCPVHRQPLIQALKAYERHWCGTGTPATASAEVATIRRFMDFVTATPTCFERSQPTGHVTGSALVVSPERDQVLLTLHAKLGRWLQLGGHADGDPDPLAVAHREVVEESGLEPLSLLSLTTDRLVPFDIDIHLIPARGAEAAHEHFDVRYVVVCDPKAPLAISEESKDLRWWSLAEAFALTDEPSMRRQFAKLQRWGRGLSAASGEKSLRG